MVLYFLINKKRFICQDKAFSIFINTFSSYNYYNVPEVVYSDLVHAGSVGQEFNFAVKGNYFYQRI